MRAIFTPLRASTSRIFSWMVSSVRRVIKPRPTTDWLVNTYRRVAVRVSAAKASIEPGTKSNSAHDFTQSSPLWQITPSRSTKPAPRSAADEIIARSEVCAQRYALPIKAHPALAPPLRRQGHPHLILPLLRAVQHEGS